MHGVPIRPAGVVVLNLPAKELGPCEAGGVAGISVVMSPTDLVIVDCAILGNWCENGSGGGVEYVGFGDLLISSSTVHGNIAQRSYAEALGGGLFIYSAAGDAEQERVVANSIFWENSADAGSQMSVQGSASYQVAMTVVHSDVQGGLEDVFTEHALLDWDESNIEEAPAFIDPDGADNLIGTADDDARLRGDSPCVDAGSNDWLPPDVSDLDGDGDTAEPLPLDLLGGPRVLQDIVDMGAFEGGYQAFEIVGEPVEAEEGLFRAGRPGDRGVGAFLVRLAMDPGGPVDATVSWHAGDPDLSVFMGETLSFDSSNFDQYQPVILAAGEDVDWIDGEAVFVVEAPGVETAHVHAREVDNEPVPAIVHVDQTATGTGTGTSWEDAFVSLQGVLAALHNRTGTQEVWLAAGTYVPAAPNASREDSFLVADGVAYYGGFPDGGGTCEERDPETHETILSGDLNGDDDTVGNGENSYHVVSVIGAENGVVLDGLTIMAGHADGGVAEHIVDRSRGSGMFASESQVTVRNCYFHDNRSWSPVEFTYHETGGAGVFATGGSLSIINCVFEDNRAEADGFVDSQGGAVFAYSALEIEASDFVNNFAESQGGAVYAPDGGRITNSRFEANQSSSGACALLWRRNHSMHI